MKKVLQTTVIAVFAVMIFGLAVLHIFGEDTDISKTERRKLAVMPEFSKEAVLDKSFMNDFETYLMDQFPMRDGWKKAKAVIATDILMQQDNHNIYYYEGGLYKWDDKLSPESLKYFVNKINSISEKYFKNNDVYYSIIPDKSEFTADKSGHPSLDYDSIYFTVNKYITGAEYIDIRDELDEKDYYRTDSHWEQQNLEGVVNTLGSAMGFAERLPDFDSYRQEKLEPFYGVYLGQSSLPVKPDTITYLHNDIIDSAEVTSAEIPGKLPVYDLEKFNNPDSYDLFLHGAQAVLTIENKKAETDRELVIFRDSFGSSITPLLIPAYSRITMIDLRYVAENIMENYAEFNDNQDVLFLYSASMVNGSMVLK